MSTATVARPFSIVSDEHAVLSNVSWDTYERLLADDEERNLPRMTYDQGVLELVTPSKPHDASARTIARFVDIASAILEVPIQSVGSTTFKRRDLERGFEADESFYIQNEARVRHLRDVDLAVDPPPDLVLEMEMSRSALNKLRLFASMGIPEVWRCDGDQVTFFILSGETYQEATHSLALPPVSSVILTQFLQSSRTMLSPDWFKAVSAWAQDQQPGSNNP